jgi:DNA-binding FadR family transcriptional regulator
MPDRRKLHEQVMGDVLAAILRREYPVGKGLPREVDLAEAHGVSRYVARECIQALRDRGVLTVKHGRGTTIAPQSEWNLFDESLLAALLGGPEGRSAREDAQECRRIAWPEVAALAAAHRTDADLERLEHAAGDAALPILADAAGNRFLRHVLVSLDRAMATTGTMARGMGGTLEDVVDAVRAGDVDAARHAMRECVV